ncbi:hypothetical protein SCHPADRAFT_897658 [Schizopora paradoxa]|uniref:Uncharacterized protein n=1 Tax=Schizopora paradoxa TaxID=27342 RepID=A0A0H2S7W7_9AGAM|nr:hypothetical protein SCHPADRAFT_897658 [Schizopora paradoxa]
MSPGARFQYRDLSKSANVVANFAHTLAGLYFWEAVQSFLIDLELVVTLYLRYCPIVRCVRYLRATVNARRASVCPKAPPEIDNLHGIRSLPIVLNAAPTSTRNDLAIQESLSSSSRLHCFANLAGYDAYVFIRVLTAILVVGLVVAIDRPSTSHFVMGWDTQSMSQMTCKAQLVLRVIFWALYGATLAFASLLLLIRTIALYAPIPSSTSNPSLPESGKNKSASTSYYRAARIASLVSLGLIHLVQWILLIVCAIRLASNPPEFRGRLMPEENVAPCIYHLKFIPVDNRFERRSELLVVFIYYMSVNFLVTFAIFMFCFKTSEDVPTTPSKLNEARSSPQLESTGSIAFRSQNSSPSSGESSLDYVVGSETSNSIRLAPRRRPQEPVHLTINVARTAQINARNYFYDTTDLLNLPSSSKIDPPHTRSDLSKSNKPAASITTNDSPWSSADDVEISREAPIVQNEGEIEEVAKEPPSKGKGKARADPIIHVRVVPADPAPSRMRGQSEEHGAKPTVHGSKHDNSTSSKHPSEVPSRPRKLLRELRGQGFGMIVVILLGNIAVVVCLVCRTSSR